MTGYFTAHEMVGEGPVLFLQSADGLRRTSEYTVTLQRDALSITFNPPLDEVPEDEAACHLSNIARLVENLAWKAHYLYTGELEKAP